MAPSKNFDSLAYVNELKILLCLFTVYSMNRIKFRQNFLSLFRSTPTGLLHAWTEFQ